MLATTGDESVGHAYDKVAKLLALEWKDIGPGAALEAFCKHSVEREELPTDIPDMPAPLRGRLAFSYSGLHSAVEKYIRLRGGIQSLDHPTKVALAQAFQDAAIKQLEKKLMLALDHCRQQHVQIRHVVLSGGVASNLLLRDRYVVITFKMNVTRKLIIARLRASLDQYTASDSDRISLVFPPVKLCTGEFSPSDSQAAL